MADMAGRILALDVGDVRIGVAVSDPTGTIAQPLEVYRRVGYGPDSRYVAALCQRMDCESVLLGLPLNMDGTEGERAAKSRKLAKTVELWSGLPVRMWDERQTTCAAADLLDESGTYGSRRKEILDSVSATVILEDYLAWRKEHPGEM